MAFAGCPVKPLFVLVMPPVISFTAFVNSSTIKMFLGIMTVFNWKVVTHAAATDGLWTRTSTWGGTALSALVGLSMCAFLAWMVLARWLSGARYQADHARAYGMERLQPGSRYLGWLALMVLGFNYSSSGGGAAHTSRTEIVFGSSSSFAPFWFAVAGVALWTVLRRLEGSGAPRPANCIPRISA
jgi:hypothetical protein